MKFSFWSFPLSPTVGGLPSFAMSQPGASNTSSALGSHRKPLQHPRPPPLSLTGRQVPQESRRPGTHHRSTGESSLKRNLLLRLCGIHILRITDLITDLNEGEEERTGSSSASSAPVTKWPHAIPFAPLSRAERWQNRGPRGRGPGAASSQQPLCWASIFSSKNGEIVDQ